MQPNPPAVPPPGVPAPPLVAPPAIAAPPVIAPPVILPPMAAATTRYVDKYSAPSPFPIDWAALLAHDNALPANAPGLPTAANCMDAAINSSNDVPKGYFIQLFVPATNSYVVRLLHRPATYPRMPAHPTPWDATTFAFTSDVLPGGHINAAQFPANAFDYTPSAFVPSHDALMTAFTDDPDRHTMDPFDAADAANAVASLRSRFLVRVPPPYLQLALGLRLQPRELLLFANTIIGNGHAATCSNLLQWIRLALTARPPTAAAPLVNCHPATCWGQESNLLRPEVDADLHRHIWNLLLTDLPALRPMPSGVDPHLALLIATLRDDRHVMHADNVAARETAAVERELDRAAATAARYARRRVSEMFPVLWPRILMFCEVPSEDLLPEIWELLANASARDRRETLAQAVAARAASLGAATTTPPLITKLIIELFLSCAFGARDPDDLSEGLQPFQVTHRACGAGREALHQINRYDLSVTGQATTTLADQDALSVRTIPFPKCPTDLQGTLTHFSIILDVALGINHRLSVYIRESFLRAAWPRAFDRLLQIQQDSPASRVEPDLLRAFQMQFVSFFNDYRIGAPVPDLPPLDDVLKVLALGTFFTLPPIPQRYVAPASTRPAAPPPTRYLHTPSTAGSVAPSIGSAVSRLTTPTAAPPPGTVLTGPNPRTGGNRVANPGTDWTLRLAAFEASGKKIQDLKAAAPASAADRTGATTPLCLSFHLRGTCFDNCGRRDTHRLLTSAEAAALSTFTATHLPATAPPPL